MLRFEKKESFIKGHYYYDITQEDDDGVWDMGEIHWDKEEKTFLYYGDLAESVLDLSELRQIVEFIENLPIQS